MAYIGKTPTAVPLTSGDITNGIITTAKIADDAISAAKLASGVGGKVLQVVTGTTTYGKTNSSTSFTDVESSSGVTWVTSITPSSSSNKIFIISNIGSNIYESGSSEGDQRGNLQMFGDINGGGYSTLSGVHKVGGYSYGGGSYGVSIGDGTPLNLLWSPNTTSQCNVKFQFKPLGNNGYMDVVGTGSQVNTCTLLEVSG